MFESLQFLNGSALLIASSIAAVLFLACLTLGWRVSATLILAASIAGADGRTDIFGVHLAFWCIGALAVAILTIAFEWLERLVFARRSTHLLLKVKEKWIAGIIATILMVIASAANLRFFGAYLTNPSTGWPVTALLGTALAIQVIACFPQRRNAISLGLPAISATAAVMALMPVIASPSALLLGGTVMNEAFNHEPTNFGKKAVELALNIIVLPAIAFCMSTMVVHSGFTEATIFIVIAYCIPLMLQQNAKIRRTAKRRGDYARVIEEEVNEERRKLHEIEIDIISKEKENLINLLDLRRDELRDVTEKLTGQREFMQELYNSIQQAKNSPDISAKDAILHESLSKIALRLNFSDERNEINNKVEELHKDFSIRLKSKYPQISQQECKLAALLRLEFPTKYIATVLNISPKSVEVERHRLRQKFGLDRQTKLTDFIKTI